jgi:glycosyltransferase involved in cell wall biosynthesis
MSVAKVSWVQVEKGESRNSLSIQIIIAALNEEEGIGPTIAELKEYLYNAKILVVDGNSVDKTTEKAKILGAEIVFQGGRGKGNAFAKAIEHVELPTDYVIITDADFTYPAKYLPKMIKILEEHPHIGMVCGNRFTEDLDRRALHDLFYIGNRIIAFTHNFLNGVQLADPLTGLRVVRAEILRNWNVKSKGFDLEVELNHRVERKGFGIAEVPIQYRERLGEKKLKARHGFEILKRILLETTN